MDKNAFVTSFDTQLPGVNTAYGTVRFLLGQNSPALATLTNGGLAQGLITLEPCALWAPHIHPRCVVLLDSPRIAAALLASDRLPALLGNGHPVGRGAVFLLTLI